MTNDKLDSILTKLCEGIDIPIIKEVSDGKEAERLIEQLEIRNYPYSPIYCSHLEEKGIGEDCVYCQQQQYETYKSYFLTLAAEKGLEHVHTLKAAFDYYSTLITRYFLTECDELLDQVYPHCYARGSWSAYYIMAVQARAFLRFKQGRYQESLDYFNLQIETLGPNEMIYENMALAYSRLNENKKASVCYAQAMLLVAKNSGVRQYSPTLLMGLATVLDNVDDSLAALDESMRLLKIKYDKPHSLMAKALGATGDLYLKRNDIDAAEKCFREAVDIFVETCGEDTPLTSNAMNKLANALLLLNRKKEALDVFVEALRVWVKVDDESFDPNRVAEALLALNKEYLENRSLGKIPDETIAIIDLLQEKIARNPMFNQDINVLCLFKFIYELHIINQDIPRAIISCRLFNKFLGELDATNLRQFLPYRDKLLEESSQILGIMERM